MANKKKGRRTTDKDEKTREAKQATTRHLRREKWEHAQPSDTKSRQRRQRTNNAKQRRTTRGRQTTRQRSEASHDSPPPKREVGACATVRSKGHTKDERRQTKKDNDKRRQDDQRSKEAKAPLAGYSRKVTLLAFIHRRVRPLDGQMVVASPYRRI